MNVVASCLQPVRFDIVALGERYGYVFAETRFNWRTRERYVRWFARMDLPERVDAVPFAGGVLFAEADTMDEAIHQAFEDFADSEKLPLDDLGRIGKGERLLYECLRRGGRYTLGEIHEFMRQRGTMMRETSISARKRCLDKILAPHGLEVKKACKAPHSADRVYWLGELHGRD